MIAGGCYNVFTKKFGSGATNLLEAKVVLANGASRPRPGRRHTNPACRGRQSTRVRARASL